MFVFIFLFASSLNLYCFVSLSEVDGIFRGRPSNGFITDRQSTVSSSLRTNQECQRCHRFGHEYQHGRIEQERSESSLNSRHEQKHSFSVIRRSFTPIVHISSRVFLSHLVQSVHFLSSFNRACASLRKQFLFAMNRERPLREQRRTETPLFGATKIQMMTIRENNFFFLTTLKLSSNVETPGSSSDGQ